MIEKIISNYGTVRFAYFTAPPYDIHKIYLLFNKEGRYWEKGCFRVDLKNPFYLIQVTSGEIDQAVEDQDLDVYMYDPAEAYTKLVECDYQDPEDKQQGISANRKTWQTILDLLLESV